MFFPPSIAVEVRKLRRTFALRFIWRRQKRFAWSGSGSGSFSVLRIAFWRAEICLNPSAVSGVCGRAGRRAGAGSPAEPFPPGDEVGCYLACGETGRRDSADFPQSINNQHEETDDESLKVIHNKTGEGTRFGSGEIFSNVLDLCKLIRMFLRGRRG